MLRRPSHKQDTRCHLKRFPSAQQRHDLERAIPESTASDSEDFSRDPAISTAVLKEKEKCHAGRSWQATFSELSSPRASVKSDEAPGTRWV